MTDSLRPFQKRVKGVVEGLTHLRIFEANQIVPFLT
jgi:hypothetical protein